MPRAQARGIPISPETSRRPQPGEERADVAGDQVGPLEGGEVATLLEAAPVDDVVVVPLGEDADGLFTGADSLDTVAAYIGMLMMDFTVESPPELVPRLQVLSERYARAVAASVVT